MPGTSTIGHATLRTELLVTHGAHFANATATVVVHHHPIANGERLWSTRPELCNDATGLMAGDHLGWLGSTVAVQVGATESRGTNFHHRFTRASMGVRKFTELSFSVPFKHHATHTCSPLA